MNIGFAPLKYPVCWPRRDTWGDDDVVHLNSNIFKGHCHESRRKVNSEKGGRLYVYTVHSRVVTTNLIFFAKMYWKRFSMYFVYCPYPINTPICEVWFLAVSTQLAKYLYSDGWRHKRDVWRNTLLFLYARKVKRWRKEQSCCHHPSAGTKLLPPISRKTSCQKHAGA